MKKKILIGSGVFTGMSVLNIWFSMIIHVLLSEKRLIELSSIQFKTCIQSLAVNEKHLQLFLCLEIAIVLFVILVGFTTRKVYHSEMQKITDIIETPKPAGQKQHGSARWLTEKEFEQVFDSIVVDELKNKYEEEKGDEKI